MRYSLILAALVAAMAVRAETAIGDWGHFISYTPTVYLNNPEGRAFTIRINVMQWGIKDWHKDKQRLRLVGPGGKIVFDGEYPYKDSTVTLDVPEGAAGVYCLHTTDNVWVWSSLNQSVVWTGVPGRHLMDDQPRIPNGVDKNGKPKLRRPEFYEKEGHLVFQAAVPRRWWFWVPKDVNRFTCRVMRADRCMSQREDWGFFIITPRGQRIRALWGQPPHAPQGKDYRQDQTAEVEVEPGACGRFWCLEVSLGDSHEYSNINISFDGVPPYLARSPEEWFDPATGKRPELDLYDSTAFIQSALDDATKKRWPALQHFSPCPSLGDADGTEVLGDAQFKLWNPEGRDLQFMIGTYLPRSGFKTPPSAAVKITGPDDQAVLDQTVPLLHIHGEHGKPLYDLKPGKGVATVAVTGAERFLAFTYPATPLVLAGKPIDGDWSRFEFTTCTPRNWYFFVPKGVTEFRLRLAAKEETDVVRLEICAPDRVQAMIYGRSGEQTVLVPAGLDGKIWYLRPSVGSASRIITEKGQEYRYQDISMTVDLQGVPAYLAPTWEQWFDPRRPQSAFARGAIRE